MNILNEYRSHLLFLTLGAIFLSFSSLSAQSWNAERYFGIPEQDKQEVLKEEFDVRSAEWKLNPRVYNERVYDGDYYCATLSGQGGIRSIPVKVDQNGDYEMEIRLRYARGVGTPAAGLYWGGDRTENGFSFNYDTDGQFAVTLHRRGHQYVLQPKTAAANLTKYSYNSLLLRKVGNRWYLFTNQQLVHQMPAQSLYGREVGFFLDGRMAIEVDFLRVSQFNQDDKGPTIELTSPGVPASGILTVAKAQQMIKGTLSDDSGLGSLSINGHSISVAEDGSFSASLHLPEGSHQIELVALDALGNESRQSFQIAYTQAPPKQPPYQDSFAYEFEQENKQSYDSPQDQTPADPWEKELSSFSNPTGENYLLLIGVNRYANWTPLFNPVKDCQDIARVLTSQYQFDQEHLITLFNEQASRENILETFESLQEKLQPEDNLLIYYAGHGFYDQGADLGYWVPVNARLKKVPDFIRNSTIHDYLRAIDTKHTLLIADACYSGSLFATYRSSLLREDMKSRWAFTSGDIEKVFDGEPGKNSPFARYLIRYLEQNRRTEFPANELIETVGANVQRNTSQSPQGSSLRRAGDEGGVFMFRRK
ncbi:MAG: caspase family protein [Bacteroidota bacterium]